MRFGVFVPQGWRLDLAGVPAADQWATMRDLARARRRRTVRVDLGLRPLPHRAGADRRGHVRGVVADGRVRRVARSACGSARCARAWATATRPTWPRSPPPSTSSPAAGSRWASAAAGTSTSGARTATASRGAGDRLGMLDEGVQIMRQLWTTGTATLHGKHYQVDGAIGRPLPVQDGGIPLWIAGGGERKTLRIAAQYAQYTNFDATPDVFKRKSEILAEHCKDVGTDFDAIARSANFNVIIGETEKDVADKLAWVRAHYEPLICRPSSWTSCGRVSHPGRWSARPNRSSSGCTSSRHSA